ncbi:hypothetical protein ACQ5SP_02710 [Rhodovulum sp. YNF3179]|uniref:hypothetical protein n=1 Tax=Rhodovulum sp. YNF3179 TaxID=3425127 RepID=UPI003D34EF54
MRNSILGPAVVLLAVVILGTSWSAARAETFAGTNVDSRVIVGVKADAAAVQAFMPDGWAPIGFPRGPLKDANLLVSFVDGMLMLDAQGKALDPASRRAVVFLGLGKQVDGDGVRIFVLRTYSTEPPGTDPYGVNVPADVSRTTSISGPANGGRTSLDSWKLTLGDDALEMTLNHTTGNRVWSASEAKSFSAANPDFYRIYRYDSLTDVVMSGAMGKPLTGTYALSISIADLAAIFDGSEETVAILDIPVRVREIFLP